MRIPDFELEVFFGRHEFSAPYLLAQSDCEALNIAELLALEPDPAAAREAFLQTRLGYAENDGRPELRRAIARLYQGVTGDQVLVQTGAQEGIFSCCNVLLDKGDHLVCMFPAYQSLYEVARSVGCDVSFWRFRQTARGWVLDFDELESLLRPDTRAIVINSPHNPTGYALSEAELRALCELAARRGIRLIADEVYKGLEDPDGPDENAGRARSSVCELYERGVSIGVLSKAYGLPGLRIGWLASRDRETLTALSRFKNYLSICCATPSEELALTALRHAPALLARNRAIVRANLALADAFFARHAGLFIHNRPLAGPVGFHRLNIDGPATEFCERLARQAGVLLLPGNVYGVDEPYFRMGYGRRNFGENLAHFEAWLAEAKMD